MTPCETPVRPARIVCAFLSILSILPASASASEIWVAPTYQADLGGVGVGSNVVWPVTPAGAVRLAWAVPADLQTFQAAKLVLIPQAGGGSTATVFLCHAQNSQLVQAACAGPFNHQFTAVANQLTEIDISAAIAPSVGLPGANYLSVLAFTAPTTSTDRILGLRFAYAAATPSGVATLGANTYGGTQTAPAFVGDGSGLTNLPFPAGAATLGANTFTGTQTINGGHLDLDPSSATGGNILKNGTRFLHTLGTENLFLGESAGATNPTNDTVGNTGVGHMALTANRSHNNTGVGAFALRSSVTGSHNTAVGWGAMQMNNGGYHNVALGSGTLGANTTGTNNTSIGFASMLDNTTGDFNTALGVNGLVALADGSFNVGLGDQAGFNLVTGSNNIYLGASVYGAANESNTMYLGKVGTQTRTYIAGVRGIATANADALPVVIDSAGQLGTVAPNGIATLVSNTFSGTQTLDGGNLDLDSSTAAAGNLTKNGTRFLHNFGVQNTFLGLTAGNFTMTGNGNTAVGVAALAQTTIGSGNTAIGTGALFSNTGGQSNVAIGHSALTSNLGGSGNTASGVFAMEQNTTGHENSAYGTSALRFNLSGFRNTATGFGALELNTTGEHNTATGFFALHSNTVGDGNAAFGREALLSNVNGNRNTALGTLSDVASPALSNAIAIGYAAVVDASNKVRLGNNDVTLVETAGDLRVGAGSTTGCVQDGDGTVLAGACLSDLRLKTDITAFSTLLDKVVALEPVRFRWNREAYPELQLGSALSFGLIAQDAERAIPELVAEDARGFKVVRYNLLPLLLLQAVKEQQAIIRRQQDENAALKARLDRLERRILQRSGS